MIFLKNLNVNSGRILFVLLFFTLSAEAGLSDAVNHPKVQQAMDHSAFKIEIAAAMIFRDEAPYLKEWIEYHRLLGVEKFYLYNNLSQDNYLEVLQPYIAAGVVKLTEWDYESVGFTDWDKIQCDAYRHALKKARKDRVKWLAVIDSDEFIVPRNYDSLTDFLKPFSDYGGVMMSWVVFGTSYVEKIPDDQLMIETLLLNGGYGSDHFKTILRTDCVLDIPSPHFARYVTGKSSVLLGYDYVQLNHYWCRDEWYLYNIKIPRRAKLQTSAETCQAWANGANHESPASLPILRFVEPLRQIMGFE